MALSWETIADTPWWLYLLFFVLIRLALLVTKPRTIPIKNLFFMPIIFIPLSLLFLFSFSAFDTRNIFLCGSMLLSGLLIGWIQFRVAGIQVRKASYELYIPGSWLFFFLVLGGIGAKFYYGGHLPTDPTLFMKGGAYEFVLPCICGLSIGLTLGRFLYVFRRLKS